MCLIPNPNEIRVASGEQKLRTKSGENFFNFFESSLVRSTLARNFPSFVSPPYLPTKFGSNLRIFANFDTSSYLLEVQKNHVFTYLLMISSENSNCFGVRISIHIFKQFGKLLQVQ